MDTEDCYKPLLTLWHPTINRLSRENNYPDTVSLNLWSASSPTPQTPVRAGAQALGVSGALESR